MSLKNVHIRTIAFYQKVCRKIHIFIHFYMFCFPINMWTALSDLVSQFIINTSTGFASDLFITKNMFDIPNT